MTYFPATPVFMKQFQCTGAACPDTCCKGWNMQLGSDKQALYATKAPELLEAITPSAEGEHIMKRDSKSDFCVKFSDGLCSIHAKYGAEFLGDACYFYPRVTRAVGSQTVMTGTLSCPEIARLALFGEDAFAPETVALDHVPTSFKDYLPEGMEEAKALSLHQMFLDAALNAEVTPQHTLLRLLVVAQSLERIDMHSWHEAAPFYLGLADSGIPAAVRKENDAVFLLQSLCGLVFASRKINNNARLMQTIAEMEAALHVTIRMDTLEIVPLPDSLHASETLLARWQQEWAADYAPVLRRYLAMQLSLAIFPFGGFGDSLSHRLCIIGIRLACISLALAANCQRSSMPLSQETVIRIIQSLSRFLDHLGDPEFSLKIYGETGWLQKERLRGLLGC